LFGKWEKIGTKDLGGNLQPVDVTKVDKPHGFFCNGCSSGSEGVGYARYIALAVRCDPNFKSGGNLDLCEGCMSKLIAKEQGIIDSLLPEGHKDNHPFLRVLYNTNGYYEYWNDWAKFIEIKYITMLCIKIISKNRNLFYILWYKCIIQMQ